jgi:hypothetical protein
MIKQKNVAIEFTGAALCATGAPEPKLPDDVGEAIMWVRKQAVSFLRKCDYLKRNRNKGNNDHHTGFIRRMWPSVMLFFWNGISVKNVWLKG